MNPALRVGRALPVALVIQSLFGIRFAREHSETFDEPGFIVAGMAYATTGVDRHQFIHPPLAKRIAGMAALAAGADPAGAPDDRSGTTVLHGRNADRSRRVAFAARMTTLAGLLALTTAVSRQAAAWWGPGAGALAGLLMAVEPNLLAHGSLATTDLWVALFAFLFFRTAARIAGDSARPGDGWRLGVQAGFALSAKFSAVGFLPALAAGCVAAQGRDWRPALRRVIRSLPRAAVAAAAVVVAASCVHVRLFDPGWGAGGVLSWSPVTLSAEPLVRYALGLRWAVTYAGGGPPAYFLGAMRDGPIPAYFAVAFLLKVPLAITLLALLAAAAGRSDPRRRIALLGVLALFTAVLHARLLIGLRHVLPVIPLAVLLASSVAALPGWSRRARAGIAVFGWLWCAGSTLRAAPHLLAHFNEIAGGPAGGWRYLSDSNIDWGQDLPALKRWLDANGVPEIPLYSFGGGSPAAWGVKVAKEGPDTKDWKGGLVAISVSYLNGAMIGDLSRFGWARSLTPVATPGWSIHVYEVGNPESRRIITSPVRPSGSRRR